MAFRPALLAVAAGLVLADASVVTLALPQLLEELDTSVEGVAAVLGLYTAVLAIALLPVERAAARHGANPVAAAGFGVFALGCAGCAVAGSLAVLLAARAVQALGGAAGLVGVFALLGEAGRHARRLWLAAAVFAAALGPALGGALTQAFDWRAIFVAQVPVGAAAAVASLRSARAPVAAAERHRFAVRPAAALALVSAALTAVLFLLVLLLVAGWSVSPLRAAVTVTVLPLAALAGARIGGPPQVRAAAGAVLVGGGVLALAWLPDARLAWTLVPQAVAGVGMGLALTALGGGLLPERTAHDAARLLTLRHAGIAAVLAVLAPIAADQLDEATARARERGVAVVLDAPLSLPAKLGAAPVLLGGVRSDRPRAGLQDAVDRKLADSRGADRIAFSRVGERIDDTVVAAVGESFRVPFVITGALALLAALLLIPWPPRRAAALGAALAVAAGTAGGYAALYPSRSPAVVAIGDPCEGRPPSALGGLSGIVENGANAALDAAACRLGASREELVLALVDDRDAERFESRHGVNPRAVLGPLLGLVGSGSGG